MSQQRMNQQSMSQQSMNQQGMDQQIMTECLVQQFKSAENVDELLLLGCQFLRLHGLQTVIKDSYPAFADRMKQLAPEDAGKVVVGVDFPAIFHATYATHEESLSDVPRVVLSRVESLLEKTDCQDARLYFLACDGKDNKRRAIFPGYKGNRKPKPDGFRELMAETIEYVTKAGQKCVTIDAYESDDVLASIAFRAKLRKQNCVLVTDDKDLWQSLGMGVVMYSPRVGSYTNEDRLKALHRITPKQVVDWLCLTGKNDIPGAKGIGEKTASDLLEAYGDFTHIVDAAHASESDKKPGVFTPAKKAGIEEFSKQHYWMARELHTLNKGLEIGW